ncbi:MAG TPA: DUF4231 domain-containing protein, partial [Candidatus Binatia bacterium]|nr:DUF4231 domain-containing protein [Candidatus Binatia bacterium]
SADPSLSGPWAAYRTWAATARYHKSAIDFWNSWSLRLAVSGAILAALGQQLMLFAPEEGSLRILYSAPGILGAGVIALAAYFSSQALAENRERIWIKCRSAAESIKSLLLLYRAAVSPFDGLDRGAQLRQRVDKILREVKEIELRQSPSESVPDLHPLAVEEYIAERVDDQIGWYQRRAREYQEKSDAFRRYIFGLGAASVLLGLASAISAVSAWIAVIATITAALTAHMKNQRYQSLIAMYSATALRLGLLKSEWAESRKTDGDKADRDAFIQRCEETMALENGAWVAQWSEQHASQVSARQENEISSSAPAAQLSPRPAGNQT